MPGPGVLRRYRDLRLLWAGATVSFAGDAVTRLALPLVAVITLRASAVEVGGLVAATSVGWLIVSLPAGAWVDRARHRELLVATNVVAALVMALVPIAWAGGFLSLGLLYAIGAIAGCLAVAISTASFAVLPALVPGPDLPDANAAVQGSASVAAVAGPSIAGALVEVVGAPAAVAADAASFALCAAAVAAIRLRQPRPTASRLALRREIGEGLRHTFGDPLLRGGALTSGSANLMVAAWSAVAVLFLVRDLRVPAGVVGVLFAATGVGGVVAALVAARVIRRLGLRVALWLPLTIADVPALLMPLAGSGGWLALFAVGGFATTAGGVLYSVALGTYLQEVTPPAMLGRAIASVRVVSRGALALGGLLGGATATWLSLRGAMWLVCAGLVVSSAPIAVAAAGRRRAS